ncbi:uncharacterized protein LOC134677391 isoform X2 [Cydia fagiglandana]|uniref:uncharacterized protein LOC134677391 isoform X2 n=1 Tax=Cydia fagiglandana TaxID=1458189 RepID=UPI002FEE3846
MAAEDIKKLIASRGQCKASMTRMERFLQQEPQLFTVESLTTRKASMNTVFQKYQDVCVQLSVLDPEHHKDDLDDDTEDRFYSIMTALECALNVIEKTAQQNTQTAEGSGKAARLPSLDIPVFDGRDVALYKSFIEMFEAVVHRDARIPVVQKLCFLKKYLKGEPLQLIDNLPIIGASYDSALELLKKRYDNPALIISSHVNTLLDIPALHRGTALQLRDMVAKVRQHLTALQNLEQPVTSWDAILACILLRKLDSFTVRLYHSERDNSEQHTAKFPSFWLQISSAE